MTEARVDRYYGIGSFDDRAANRYLGQAELLRSIQLNLPILLKEAEDQARENYMTRLWEKAEAINDKIRGLMDEAPAEIVAKIEAILANGIIHEQVGRVPYYELNFSTINGGTIYYNLGD